MKKKQARTENPSDRWSYLWLGVGTLLGFFWVIPLTLWLSPVFFLRFVRTQKVWRGFLLVWLASFVTLSIILRSMIPFPLPMYLVTMAISALMVNALPYLADRLLAHRAPGFSGTLVFPLAVTAMDFVSVTTSPLGSIGAQAYAQHGNLALLQLLSITGMWGITFLVNWFGAVVNWIWESSCDWPKIRRGVAVYAGVMLLVTLYGGARLAFAPTSANTVRVHGITAVDMHEHLAELKQAQQNEWETYRQKTADLHERYFEETVREARAGAQLVLWPELAAWVASEDEAALVARGQGIAREEGIYLAMPMGTVYQDGRPFENKLIVVDPAGEIVLEHHKFGGHTIEGFKPGDGVLRTAHTPFGTLSGVICWDTDFPAAVSQAGRNGTDILLSPSMDYRAIDPIHAHMAVFRAIENGISVIRQADNGLSIVADPYGRISASVDHFTASERVMVAQVPANGGVFTLYPIIGDLFGWLAVAGLILVALWSVIQGRQAARTESSQLEGQALV